MPSPDSPTTTSQRVLAIDVFRGFVMLLMMAEVMHGYTFAEIWPQSALAGFIAQQSDHVKWVGMVLHDVIQPAFSFLVGTAMVFSLQRRAQEQSSARRTLHAAWRALLLIWLGIFLRSDGADRPNFTFEDTLTQIGLGYFFLYLLAPCKWLTQLAALATLLIGYWLAFLLYPLPPADFDYPSVSVPVGWEHLQTGLAAHWNMNSNAAWAFDRWFLNLFPRESVFTHNEGGYATLSFIPTLATMLLGLFAGRLLVENSSHAERLKKWGLWAGGCLAAGLLWHLLGCPIVKRIWTPSWTLFSGGVCFALLAVFYWLVEVRQFRWLAFPLLVVGANSLVAYFIAHLWPSWLKATAATHFGWLLGGQREAVLPVLSGAFALVAMWVFLWWLHRRKIFVRI